MHSPQHNTGYREVEEGDLLDRFIHYALQPLLLLAALFIWLNGRDDEVVYLLILVGTQIVLGVLEYWRPARPHWRQGLAEKTRNVLIWAVTTVLAVLIGSLYSETLAQPLAALRAELGMDVWPHHWPLVVQLFMVFFLSELLWYWIHRAEHRWSLVWRTTGHGAHHSFKRLGAINFGANHPFEMFFLVLPAALIELFFGVGVAAAGATVLLAVQAGIAHTNLNMNSRVIGWLFTTSDYHLRHHSMVLEESNTNYGCSAIVWDRMFGTFADSRIDEAGTGPSEPSTWRKFMMPFKEVSDTTIAPD